MFLNKASIPLAAAAAALLFGAQAHAQAVYFSPSARADAMARYYSYSNRYDSRHDRGYVRFAPPRYGAPPRVIDRAPVIPERDVYAAQGRRRVQQRLNELGYNAGSVDGVYGQQTRNAMAAFQADIGARATGRLTADQIEALYSAGPAKRRPVVREPEPDLAVIEAPAEPPVPLPTPARTKSVTAAPAAAPSTDAMPAAGPTEPAKETETAPAASARQPAPVRPADPADEPVETSTIQAMVGPTADKPAKDKPQPAPAPKTEAAAAGQADSARPLRTIVATRTTDTVATGAGDQSPTGRANSARIAQAPSDSATPTIDGDKVITLPAGAAPRPLPRGAVPADPFREAAYKPMVFGMTTGTGKEEARQNLALNGYRDCAETGETLFCTSSNRSMTDTIAVAFAANQPSKPVYLIRRVLAFKNPVSREFLERQMQSRYPELLSQPDGTLSSADNCRTTIGLKAGAEDDDALEVLYKKRKSDSAIDDETLDLIDACPDYYALAFDGTETVSNVEIVLFSSASMRSEHSAALRERRSMREPGAENPADNLKF